MKLKIITVLMTFSLLFSSNATASFFTAPSTNEQILQLISKLSDDIGLMADRILVMADKIGEMSDRIVHTEELLADLNNNSSDSTTPTLLISADSNTVLYANQVPEFSMNIQAPQMLIYVSSSLTMQTNTISILVNNSSDLEQQWSELKTLASNNKIYIAVKTIDGNTISSLSNVLTYTTLY